MFTLATQHTFEPDPHQCWVSANVGYDSNVVSWHLHLECLTSLTQFSAEPVLASFGIDSDLPMTLSTWQDLTGLSLDISGEPLPCGFMFHCDMSRQWENLFRLRLRFDQTCGAQIEVFAEGRACVEAEPDIFPEGEVGFQIDTLVTFTGVSINVPLNAADPLSYSTTRIKALLPHFAFSPPILRQTKDESGQILAIEALFRPAE